MAKKTKKKAKNKKNGKGLTKAKEKPFGYVFGRPTKYRPEMCNLTEYLKHCKKEEDLPSIVGYAVFLGVCKDTMFEWGKTYKNFSDSLKDLKAIEEGKLLKNGLNGDWKSAIVKLILSSNHGYVERLDTTTLGAKIQAEALTIDQIKERLAAAEAEGLNGLDGRSISGGWQ